MKCFITIILLATVGGASLAQPGVEPGRPARVAGTRVSLVPPQSFVPSERFTGYERESEGAAIIVVEMPAPVSEVAPALSDTATLSKKGMVLLGREEVTVGGFPGLLFYFGQTALGAELRKWSLVIGDAKELIMVTASFPKESEKTLSPLLKRSVLSTRWHRDESVAVDEGLNFKVSEAGVLKLAKRVTNMLLFSPGGVIPIKSTDDPYFVIGPSTLRLEIKDQKSFSVSRVFRIEGVTSIGVVEPNAITVDDLSGYEILTTGRDEKSGQPVSVYQVTLFDGDFYYLMQGIVGARNASTHVGAFRQMARSFKRVLPQPGRAGSVKP